MRNGTHTALVAGTWLSAATLAAALVVTTYAPIVHAWYVPTVTPEVAECMANTLDVACTDRPAIQGTPAGADTLPPCATEDGTECYWNGYTMGNREGRTFINMGGVTYYTDGTFNYN